MRSLAIRAAAVAVVSSLAVGAAGAGSAARAEGDGWPLSTPDCIDYWGEARYGAYGYDHVVHLRNGCKSAARCQVWTDVNEEKQRVRVPAGKHKEVLTWRGSPAREFTAHARCELED